MNEEPALRTLMAEYQAGSIEAFDRLHDTLAPDLKAYLSALCRDATRADDLLQETFLQIHRSRAVHTPGEPVRPWVFAIAKRVFLMYLRSATRRSRHEVRSAREDQRPGVTAAETDRLHARQQVESALRHVSADSRRAFLLHHLFGFSFKEVAARLGIEAGAAKIRSSRAAVSCARCRVRVVMSNRGFRSAGSYCEEIVSSLTPVRPLPGPARRAWVLIPLGLLLAATATLLMASAEICMPTRRCSRGERRACRRCWACGS